MPKFPFILIAIFIFSSDIAASLLLVLLGDLDLFELLLG
jgi:hypothetical protein